MKRKILHFAAHGYLYPRRADFSTFALYPLGLFSVVVFRSSPQKSCLSVSYLLPD